MCRCMHKTLPIHAMNKTSKVCGPGRVWLTTAATSMLTVLNHCKTLVYIYVGCALGEALSGCKTVLLQCKLHLKLANHSVTTSLSIGSTYAAEKLTQEAKWSIEDTITFRMYLYCLFLRQLWQLCAGESPWPQAYQLIDYPQMLHHLPHCLQLLQVDCWCASGLKIQQAVIAPKACSAGLIALHQQRLSCVEPLTSAAPPSLILCGLQETEEEWPQRVTEILQVCLRCGANERLRTHCWLALLIKIYEDSSFGRAQHHGSLQLHFVYCAQRYLARGSLTWERWGVCPYEPVWCKYWPPNLKVTAPFKLCFGQVSRTTQAELPFTVWSWNPSLPSGSKVPEISNWIWACTCEKQSEVECQNAMHFAEGTCWLPYLI